MFQDNEEIITNDLIFLKKLLNSLQDLIVILSPQGKIVEILGSWLKNKGIPRGALIGKNMHDIFADKMSIHTEAIERASKGENVLHEWELPLNGQIYYMQSSLSTVKLDNYTFIVSTLRDISLRKHAEDALKKSEGELRALFSAMTDAVMVLNSEGVYLKIAPTNPFNLYKPSEELLGKRIHDVLPKNDADKILEQVRLALNTRKTINFEYKLNIGTREVWFDGYISALSENTVFWIARDNTERKNSEDVLRESEERFRHTFEFAAIGQSMTSCEGKLVHVNNTFSEMLGYSKEELFSIKFAELTHPDDLEKSLEALHILLNGEKEHYRMEKRYVKKNGELLWADVSIMLLRDLNDSPLHFITTVLDITNRKNAELALKA